MRLVAMLLVGWCALQMGPIPHVNAQFDDFFAEDDGGFYEEDWDDSFPRAPAQAAPFTPGVQNQGQNWNLDNPFNPGTQNQGWTWNNNQQNQWNQGNNWNQPQWNNNWNQQQNAWNQYHGGTQWNYGQNQSGGRPANPQYVTPQVTYSQRPIKIAMPETEAGPCSYVLSSGDGAWNYTMFPGKSQTFNEDRAWKVTYDRGDGFGEQSYQLKPGLYRFRQSSRGWELYRSELTAPAPVAVAPPPPM